MTVIDCGTAVTSSATFVAVTSIVSFCIACCGVVCANAVAANKREINRAIARRIEHSDPFDFGDTSAADRKR
jgi:hypothetical protein